jgi:pimeloyl-ACP methyl ester carboxylesterase
MGAELALALAAFHPTRVRSLTLSPVPAGRRPTSSTNIANGIDVARRLIGLPEALKALIEGVPDFTGLPRRDIAALPMPLNGIIGALDDERPYMERIAEARPDFRPVILPGLDHLGTWRSAVFPELAGEKRWRANCRARDLPWSKLPASDAYWRHCFARRHRFAVPPNAYE